jgi:hypothetical protein
MREDAKVADVDVLPLDGRIDSVAVARLPPENLSELPRTGYGVAKDPPTTNMGQGAHA